MGFVVLGVLLVALKLLGMPFMDRVGWWWVCAPFAAAAAWWAFADHVGLTQRRAMAQANERARKRREKQYENLGMRAPRPGGANPPGSSNTPGPRD